jgi:hypothetical protein
MVSKKKITIDIPFLSVFRSTIMSGIWEVNLLEIAETFAYSKCLSISHTWGIQSRFLEPCLVSKTTILQCKNLR